MKKFLLSVLFFIPFALLAQKPGYWKISLNNKILKVGKIGRLQKIFLSKKQMNKRVEVKVNPISNDNEWKYSFVVMDSTRKEIFNSNEINQKTIRINKKLFYDENDQKRAIIVYLVSKPIDETKMQNIRIAPQPLLQITLKD